MCAKMRVSPCAGPCCGAVLRALCIDTVNCEKGSSHNRSLKGPSPGLSRGSHRRLWIRAKGARIQYIPT